MPKTSLSCAKVYEKTAEDLGIKQETIKAVVYHMFHELRRGIADCKSHGFLIHHFATFEAFHLTINKDILRLIRAYRKKCAVKEPGFLTRENFLKDFRNLWRIRQDAIAWDKDLRTKDWNK